MERKETGNPNQLYFSERLKEVLSCMMEKSITIVEAPMGYGKTSAVREFFRDKPVDVLTLTVTSPQQDDFWNLFCDTLEQVFPQHAEAAHQLRALGFPGNHALYAELRRIIASLKLSRPIVIVVDDYHFINTIPLSRLVERIISSNNPMIRGVLITRDAYRGNSEFLHLKGQLTIIDKEQLMLSRSDIISYFAQCGVSLTEQEAETLHANTEGWISALYLYLLRYRKEGIIALPLTMYDLIDQEIFSLLSEEIKEFLFAVCPFGSFSFQQADFVWEGDNTHQLISELRFKNAFVTYDDQSKLFRMHGIFLQYLRSLFNRQSEEKKCRSYTRCGDCLMEDKQFYEAMRMYHMGRNYEKFLQAIAVDRGSSIVIEDWPAFREMVMSCPHEYKKQNIPAVFILANSSFFSNDPAFFMEQLSILEAMLQELPDACSRERQACQGFLEYLYAFQAYNDIEKMAVHIRAIERFGLKLGDMLPVEEPNWTVGAPSVLLMFHRVPGRLAAETAAIKQNLPIYSALAGGHGRGGEQLMEAEQAYFCGELAGAEMGSYMAEEIALRYGQMGNVFCAKFIQIRVAVMKGEGKELNTLLNQMQELVDTRDSAGGVLRRMLEMIKAFCHVLLGQMDGVADWIRQGEPPEKKLYLFAYPMYKIVQGMLLLQEEKYPQVVGAFRALLQDPIYARHGLFYIYAELYITLAHYQMGQVALAQQYLQDALALAVEDSLYMPFVELYAWLKPLCKHDALPKEYQESVRFIEVLGRDWTAGLRKIKHSGSLKKKSTLTKREREMALLACRGRTNQEIADELFIAQSTVKRAMVGIYRKLNIGSRSELAAVRELIETDTP